MKHLPNLEAMLERQARSWEFRRKLAEEGGEKALCAMANAPEGPWITVSSPAGSGGLELAHELAGALDWQVFDREILTAISENTTTQEAVLAHLDERVMSPIDEYVSRLIEPSIPGSAPFHREVVRVVWGLAKQGNAIILGRGANWFLDPTFGLRVRAVAPVEARAARISKRDGIDLDAAHRKAAERDAQQTEFIRRHYDREIADPLGYDLILNLGQVTLPTAVEITVAALRDRLAGVS